MNKIAKCPFCGGNCRISFSQKEFLGKNEYGTNKIRWHIKVICSKCYSRGKPIGITTCQFLTAYPYIDDFDNEIESKVNEAVDFWNNGCSRII